MQLVDVLIQHTLYKTDKTFLYCSENDIKKYTRVLVSFNGQKNIFAFVVDVNKDSRTKEKIEKELGFHIKFINEVIDEEPIMDEETYQLAKQISSYYFYPLIGVIKTMLPTSLRPLKSGAYKFDVKFDTYIKLDKENISNFELSKRELNKIKKYFVNNSEIKSNSTILKSFAPLIEKGVVKTYKKEVSRYKISKIFDYEKNIDLTKEQNDAYLNILNSDNMVSLLFGITGSGKTEIYIKLIENYLNIGKTTIILVPEIGLTPLMISRIVSYFNESIVGVLHSSLTNSQKYDEYRKIKEGKTKIVIGTRSAIFAPINDLGLIIIDEEQDESYTQDSDLCYSSLDVALLRAKSLNAKIVLGSATPSIETMAKCKANLYNLVTLNKRYNNVNLPNIELVDLKDSNLFTYSTIFSLPLIQKIKESLSKNEQIILFVNNKGYANSYYCRGCGKIYRCKICGTPLFLHKNKNKLKCHRCNYEIKVPKSCEECGSTFFGINGFGIEKVKEEFEKLFNVNYLILDGDITQNDNETRTILEKYNNKECNVLIGTQVIAKGHDFNDVSLVGLLNADTLLTYPSYKTSFNCFALIEQLIGRAGRKKNNSLAIIQSSNFNNNAIKYAINYDYDGFYNDEIENRKLYKYPPFYNLLTISISSKFKDYLVLKSKELANVIKKYNSEFVVLGPSILKINKGKFENSITLKAKNKKDLIDISKILSKTSLKDNKISLSFMFSKLS